MTLDIRRYHPADMTALYRICLETGNSGTDGTHLYKDPYVLGHYYAAPYAVLEPELSFVLTHNGRPSGYVLGARNTATFGQRCEAEWFPPLRAAYPLPSVEDKSHDAGMIRAIHRGHERVNSHPDYPAHLHIDLLTVGQGQGWGRRMLDRLLSEMRSTGIPGVHLGVGGRNTNAIGFYTHYGFIPLQEETWGIVFGMQL